MTVARRFVISGRVQGVGYRYFAVQAARKCGVSGTVRNLPDGRVEVVAEGSAQAVADLRSKLEEGPSLARVARIDESELQPTGRYTRFDVTF
jgi:acylphosphatase